MWRLVEKITTLYEKNEHGKISIRPPFIGFIQNNWARRLSMILAAPLMILFVTALNAIQAVVFVIRCFLYDLLTMPKGLARYWHNPRNKNDSV